MVAELVAVDSLAGGLFRSSFPETHSLIPHCPVADFAQSSALQDYG